MLTRSKIKLQQSVRQVHHDLPYFNHEEDPTPIHMYKHSKVQHNTKVTVPPSEHYRSQYSDFNPNEARRSNPARNEILKELRQEYEILKSLPVEDSIHINGKKYEQNGHKYSESSSLSSSMRSKKSAAREVEQRSLKQNSRQVQNIHLQKKQLEIVIGNSMRKIEELLNNEILLKKTIHELRNQIQGRGGVHQEYEKTIKGLKKNEEDLQEELAKVRHENEKSVLKIKEIGEKLRTLQGELSGKDREIKQGFQEQKRLHELLRIEKDKYLNLEIQCKTYKMEMQLLEKEKNNEISRLVRQFQAKEGGNEKEMAYIIKKLEEDLKERDKKCHDLLVEREQLKRVNEEPVAAIDKRNDKNYIEEMLYKSREMTDQNSKALTDSVNLIIVRMAEIEKKNEETLKREIEALKRKADDAKKSGNDIELISRVTDLERVLQREGLEKGRLVQEVKKLREQLLQQENRNKLLERRVKEQDEQNQELREEIQRLEQLKTQLSTLHVDYNNLQEASAYNAQQLTLLQEELNAKRDQINTIIVSNRQREKRNEEEVKALKRKVDVAEFETEKVRREAEFNLTLLRVEHDRQAKRIVDENTRLTDCLKALQDELAKLRLSSQSKTNTREFDQSGLRTTIQSIRAKAQQDLLSQKHFYDQKLAAIDVRHAQDMKQFNEKFIAISSANQKQIAQLAIYSRMETEVLELRRALRQTLSMNATLHHLWDVKEAEYGNLNEVINSMRAY